MARQTKRDELIRTFMQRARTSGRPNTTPANLTKKPGLPGQRQFDSTASFSRSASSPPRSLPRGSSARPMEDSGLFNPLIHGNRNPGRYGTRDKYRKYRGPSRGR